MSETKIWVEQTLHGYAGGHRLISASAKLQDGDTRTMLALSDSSAARSGSAGFLTGYPLAGSSKYVLARTWLAPEMPRPGCVWTHSLLIGFADLATLSNASGLLSLFRRPQGSPASYDTKLEAPASPGPAASSMDARAGGLLDALYTQPATKVEMLADDPTSDEELLLAVWLQQWPRLRRAFRFCSFVGADRSTPSEVFDLQMVGATASNRRSVIPGAATPPSSLTDLRLNSASADLQHPNGLRSFLRLVGGDVPKGRAAMIALCQLHDTLEKVDRHEIAFSEALDVFDSLGSQQARAARKMLLEHALAQISEVDDRTFEFTLESLLSDDGDLNSQEAVTLGTALWARDPRRFSHVLHSEEKLGLVARAALPTLDDSSLITGLQAIPDSALPFAVARPELLGDPHFREIRQIDVPQILDRLPLASDYIISALVAAERSDAASYLVRRYGSARVLNAVASVSNDNMPSTWLDAVAQDPGRLGGPLASGALSRFATVALAARMDPNAVPNDYGEDPWLVAARKLGILSSTDEAWFAAFLLTRALGQRSRSRAELLRTSFERAHAALADGSMPYNGWNMIENRLAWPMMWGEWDRCGRVREALVCAFVDQGLDPWTFGHIVHDGRLFEELARLASKTRTG